MITTGGSEAAVHEPGPRRGGRGANRDLRGGGLGQQGADLVERGGHLAAQFGDPGALVLTTGEDDLSSLLQAVVVGAGEGVGEVGLFQFGIEKIQGADCILVHGQAEAVIWVCVDGFVNLNVEVEMLQQANGERQSGDSSSNDTDLDLLHGGA